MLKLGAGYIKPFAGFQYYSVNSSAPTQAVKDDIDLYSYVLGVSTSWNIGAFSIGGQVSYGMNEGLSNWYHRLQLRDRQPALSEGRRTTLPTFTPSRP